MRIAVLLLAAQSVTGADLPLGFNADPMSPELKALAAPLTV